MNQTNNIDNAATAAKTNKTFEVEEKMSPTLGNGRDSTQAEGSDELMSLMYLVH